MRSSVILATFLAWTEGFFQDRYIWRVLIVDHDMAPLWSLSCRITSPGAENCLAAPCQWVQCLGEDLRSTRSQCAQAVLWNRGYLAHGTCGFGHKAFLHSSLKPLKKIFSTANYKAFPALSLNTGLDHCTLHWFLLRARSSESEGESGPCG